MSFLNSIFQSLPRRREFKDFRHPDVWLAAVNVGKDQVYARIKGDLALLDRVPEPETGYHFKDVVRVRGPIGKTYFRDEEISVYETIEVTKRSGIPTFRFKAIVPTSNDYFSLLNCFRGERTHVEFPYSSRDINSEWRLGFCAASSIEEAKLILDQFIASGQGRKFGDLHSTAA